MVSLVTTMATTNIGPYTNMWMVEADLKKCNKASKLNRLLRRNPKPRSVKLAKQQSSQDELGDHYKSRDIVRLSCAVIIHYISSQALQVFLVDNGSSMAQHWTHASKLVEILAWRALGYDEDGMGE